MGIDYSRWNPVNLMLASILTNTTACMGILVKRMRVETPIQDLELIFLAIMLSFYLFMFIYRQIYRNGTVGPQTALEKKVDTILNKLLKSD